MVVVVPLELIYIFSVGLACLVPLFMTVLTSLVKQKKINRVLNRRLSSYNAGVNDLSIKFNEMKAKLKEVADKPNQGNPNPPPPPPPGS